MNLTKYIINSLGYGFITAIYSILIIFTLYVYATTNLISNNIINVKPLIDLQRYFYNNSYRTVWQYQGMCAELDEVLIYKPKLGSCQFDNLEFKTTLNFDNLGRTHHNKNNLNNKKKGIAIIGDSFAMGWGVDDNETFAYHLQEKLNKPIFNLAVSSYGTQREIERLIQSGLMSQVDTVVLQYCDNDLAENVALGNKETFNLEKAKFNEIYKRERLTKSTSFYDKTILVTKPLLNIIPKSLKYISSLKNKEKNELEHKYHLHNVLAKYENYLKNKKVLIFYINGFQNNFDTFEDWGNKNSTNIIFEDLQKKLGSDDYYILDGHLNTNGHKKISELILKSLKNF